MPEISHNLILIAFFSLRFPLLISITRFLLTVVVIDWFTRVFKFLEKNLYYNQFSIIGPNQPKRTSLEKSKK
jgi:hypothetical protein